MSWETLGALHLSANVAKEAWPSSSDNSAEYYISDLRVENYHRYSDETNGAVKETDWIAVTSEEYEDKYNDLGMTLRSKPYGQFTAEVEDDPAPPGMSYVGNPRYGQWRNSGGNSSWEFYSRYMLYRDLLGDSHPGYSRTEWDDYKTARSKGEGYYGGTSTNPRYGTASESIQSHPRFASSTFGRSGGFHSARSEVRTAGVHARGGGPGGGGK